MNQEYMEELYKKDLHHQDNHDDVITHLEPDILDCEVKWPLESITMNKAGAGDASKVMLKILQARLQHYMNRELPDVPAGFRKGRGTKDQIANIYWIIEKAKEFQKNIYLCFIDCVDHNKLENS